MPVHQGGIVATRCLRGGSQVLENRWNAAPEVSGATTLLDRVSGISGVGVPAPIYVTKRLQGKHPDRIEKISDNAMRFITGTESFDIPIELLRRYQDMANRTAARSLIEIHDTEVEQG